MAIRLDTKLELKNNDTYVESSLEVLRQNLDENHKTIEDIKKDLDTINRYQNLDKLEKPKDIYTFDPNIISEDKIRNAKKAILNGNVFFEHAAAGEATRLGMGTKYLINIPEKLSLKDIAKMMTEEAGKDISEEEVLEQTTCSPDELIPLSLGTRHMIQLAFDISKIAKEFSRDPKGVLELQKMLMILNENTGEEIVKEFSKNNFFGFKRENVFFMIQRSFHGINLEEGKFHYDEHSPKRLHNHGQMVMQQTMDNEIFFLDKYGDRNYMKSEDFGKILKECDDKISYNIEDIGYLTHSIDQESLAVALNMKERGYNMVMEIVANNPIKPQKGGMAAYDPVLKKNVMIESFQLQGIENKDIHFLNKNFNHYPDPYVAWSKLKETGLPMPIAVKEGYIYFQPVQGDINFLVDTQFVRRKVLKPIKNWKSPVTTPPTIKAMKEQDEQEGFKDFVEQVTKT